MEQVIEFEVNEVMHLPFGLMVSGRCWDAEFGIGDVFTELRWSQSERHGSPPQYKRVAEGIAAEVRLRVDEISAYNRLIDRMYPGLTASIRFSGTGLEMLACIDFISDIRVGKSWFLRGHIRTELGAAPD